MGFSIPHLLVVLTIVVLIFGTKRLKNIGSDLGGAIQGFRNAVKEGEEGAAENSADLLQQDADIEHHKV